MPPMRAHGCRLTMPIPTIRQGSDQTTRKPTSAEPVRPRIGIAIRASASASAATAAAEPAKIRPRTAARHRPSAANTMFSTPTTFTCVSMRPPLADGAGMVVRVPTRIIRRLRFRGYNRVLWTRHTCEQEFGMLKRCLVLVLVGWTALPVFAQRRGGPPQQGQAPSEPAPAATSTQQPDESAAGRQNREVATAAEEKISQTSHVLRLNGHDLKYLATTGTLPIRLDDGKVAARMFFVAYTKDGENVKTRPVSFLYNGGPGAATVWLHMGSFAPRHVQMADDGFQPAPPFHLVDNENSLLDSTDLVFVDAVDTGYSRVVSGVDN